MLHNLYSTPIIVWVIKSQKMWVGHVACMGEKRNTYRVWWRNLKESEHLWE